MNTSDYLLLITVHAYFLYIFTTVFSRQEDSEEHSYELTLSIKEEANVRQISPKAERNYIRCKNYIPSKVDETMIYLLTTEEQNQRLLHIYLDNHIIFSKIILNPKK